MEKLNITEGITFDDVLLVPRFSNVTPDEADTSTRLTNRISLNIPLISAPMDTVTESALAIALAQEGGIGIVHKNMPPHIQALQLQLQLANDLDCHDTLLDGVGYSRYHAL